MTRLVLDVKTFTQAAADLAAVLDTATSGGKPVVIEREDGEPVVVVSLSDWNALQGEDAVRQGEHSRLRASIAEAERGEFVETEWNGERFVPAPAVAAE